MVVGRIDRHVGSRAAVARARQRGGHRVHRVARLRERHAHVAIDDGDVVGVLVGRRVEIVSESHCLVSGALRRRLLTWL